MMKYIKAITEGGVEYTDLVLFEDVAAPVGEDMPEWAIDAGQD